MRYKVIEDAKIKSLIDAKDLLTKEAKGIQEQVTKLDNDFQKVILKINRYNDKVTPLVKPYMTEDLGEYEEYSRLYITEEEPREIRLEIVDKIELYKAALAEQKEKSKEDKKEEKK